MRCQHLRQPRARDHAVLHVVVGRDAAHRRRTPPCAPSRARRARPSSRATRISHAPSRSQIAHDLARSASHSRLGPSSSTSSAAPLASGSRRRRIFSEASIERRSIISIAPRARSRAETIVGHHAAGRRGRVEERDERAARAPGAGIDPQRDLRGDAERALGADERAEQVVARAGRALAAELHQLAVGEHDLQTGHVVRGEAVLEAVRAAGVLGHVAADRADDLARGIRRVEVSRARPRARRRCS